MREGEGGRKGDGIGGASERTAALVFVEMVRGSHERV